MSTVAPFAGMEYFGALANRISGDGRGRGERRATIENPTVSLNDPEAWDELFGGSSKSDAGIKVTPEKALTLAAVWQAVSMISGDVARLPIDVYKRTEDDGREVDKNHPAWWLARKQFNDELHAFSGWRTLMVHALIWNNAFAFIERNGRGDAVGLYPLLPDRTCVERHQGALYVVTETVRRSGEPYLKPIPYHDVLHLQGIGLEVGVGAKMVKFARNALGLGLARQGFASKFFKHGVRSGGILEIPVGASPTFAKNVEEGFLKHHEGEEGWFRTVIARDGVKFHQTSFNAQEAQMNETSEEAVREVARYFNLQPSRLGVTGSVSYNSKSEDNQDYLDTTLSPWLTGMTYECNSKLLSQQQQFADTHYFEHNTRALLRMDYLKRVQAGSMGTKARLFTVDEWRQGENLSALPNGEGGKLPPLQDPNKFAGGADKGENDKGRGPAKDGTEEDAERSLMTRRIVFGMTNQARHKAESHRAFGEWLTGNLTGHRDLARKLIGADDVVNEFVGVLRSAEEVPVAELAGRVEQIASQFERRF